jgi:hypothetical protein
MNVWIPVITFLLGQLSLIALEFYREVRATAHEKAAHERATRERRSEFQRETLLQLQEWTNKFVTACVLEFYSHKELEQKGTAPPKELLPPKAVAEALGFMELYRPRVADRLVRDYADELAHGWTGFLRAASPQDEARAMMRGDELLNLLNDRVGQLLRDEIEASP